MKQILNNLLWIEEHLPQDLIPASKQGGIGYYQDLHLVLILVEHKETTYEHKGVSYPFDLWKGCIFPIEQKKQNAFFLKYVFLENHPANKNWLYIPAESENFEEEVKLMLREIHKRNPLLGIATKPKSAPSEKAIQARKPGQKIKADKKRKNAFLLSMVDKKK